MISVIIPANNEECYIGGCLEALLRQSQAAGEVEIIVVANGCTDATTDSARRYAKNFDERGWPFVVLELEQGSKIEALNAGDRTANGEIIAYLDADIICDPELFGQLRTVLEKSQPGYATGKLSLRPTTSWFSAAYGRFWKKLPFVENGAVGAGMYAVNSAGRARWQEFPDIIADDTFARLHFSPDERTEVPAAYHWTIVEGFSNLVKVRRRQDMGMQQFASLFPHLMGNEGKPKLTVSTIGRLAFTDPIGFLVYCTVALAVRMGKNDAAWARGR